MAITPLNQGGTGADLSATGGSSQLVKQTGAGANFSVAALTTADVASVGVVKNPTSSQTITGQQLTLTKTAPFVAGNANASRYVDAANSAGWAGANAAAWIMSAHADLPSTGGIIVLGPGDYTSLPFDTIIFTKPVRLVGQIIDAAILEFSGAGNIGILINWPNTVSGNLDWGAGLKDITVYGPGGINGSVSNAGTGIQIGSTNQAVGVCLDNVLVAGCAVGLNYGNDLAWGLHAKNCNFLNSTKNFVYNLATGQGTENIEFQHCVFGNFSQIVGNEVQIAAGGSVPEIRFIDCSFDNCQVSISIGNIIFINPHFENPAVNTTLPFLTMSAGQVSLHGARFAQDQSTGSTPSAFVQQTGGTFACRSWYATSAQTMASVFKISGSSNSYFGDPLGMTGITADVVGTSSGNVVATPNANAQIAHVINGVAVFDTASSGIEVLKVATYGGVSTVAGGVPAELAQVNLTAQSAAVGSVALYNVPATGAGMYRISYYLKVTRAATSRSTLGALLLSWFDPDGTNPLFTSATNAGNTTTSFVSGELIVYAKASTVINYATNYTSTGATSMQYNVHVKLEYLG